MKKKILELLRELRSKYLVIGILYFSDSSGVVTFRDINSRGRKTLFSFESEKELIQGLKDKIKELKNK